LIVKNNMEQKKRGEGEEGERREGEREIER
jgi:hypothetical protein